MHKGDYDNAVKDIYMLEAGFIEDYFKESGAVNVTDRTDENEKTEVDEEPYEDQDDEGSFSLLEMLIALLLISGIVLGSVSLAKEKLPALINRVKSRPKKQKPVKVKPVPPPAPKYTDECAVKLEKCSKAVFDKVSEISDIETREQIKLIARYLDMIAEEVESDPRDRSKARKLANHIAPMIQETVAKYAELEKKTDRGSNVTHTLADLRKSIGMIDNFLHNLLDDLFTNDANEVNSEIAVLEKLLKTNGPENRISMKDVKSSAKESPSEEQSEDKEPAGNPAEEIEQTLHVISDKLEKTDMAEAKENQ